MFFTHSLVYPYRIICISAKVNNQNDELVSKLARISSRSQHTRIHSYEIHITFYTYPFVPKFCPLSPNSYLCLSQGINRANVNFVESVLKDYPLVQQRGQFRYISSKRQKHPIGFCVFKAAVIHYWTALQKKSDVH